MSDANNTLAPVAAAVAVQYTCTVTVPDGEEVLTHPAQQFDALAAALQHAENEVHGVAGAQYTVICTVPVKQVCSQVMASRNRAIYLGLQLPGATQGNAVELKAPQICKLVQVLAEPEGKCTLTYMAGALYVDYVAN